MDELPVAPSVPLEKVEWRVDSKPWSRGGQSWCRFVPYIDARDAALLLDEWVGPGNWRDDYEEGQLFGKPVLWCRLSILVAGEWITKIDVGVPSNMEAQKGAVSDAFKRAASVKWGVGRNVYELPTMRAPCKVKVDPRTEKQVAYPSDESVPSIVEQLREAGWDADDARVAPGDTEPVADDGEAANPPEAAPSGEKPSQAKPDGPPGKRVLDAIRERIPDNQQGAAKSHVKELLQVGSIMRLTDEQVPDGLAAVAAFRNQQDNPPSGTDDTPSEPDEEPF